MHEHDANHLRGWEEPLLVWSGYGLVALAIFITYARLPATDFYNVSQSGIAGGASRVLVYLNFPVAFAAIGLLGFAWSSLAASRANRRVLDIAAIAALLLCLVAALPGVVDQGDLDARPVNTLPAIGVAIVLLLTVLAIRSGAPFRVVPWGQWDRWSAIILGVLTFFALPWLLADAGFYIGDVPLIGRLFLSKAFEPAGATLRAVHLGDHHGFNGLLFIAVALVLGRKLSQLRPGWICTAMSWYLALIAAYGLANYLNDIWDEQLVKRGWVSHKIPSMLVPRVQPSWGLLLIGVIALWFLIFRMKRFDRETSAASTSANTPARHHRDEVLR